MRVKILRLRPLVRIPMKATSGAAAYDISLPDDVKLKPGRQRIPLGFALEIPKGYEAKIEPRSGNSVNGLAAKRADTIRHIDADVLVGKIDSDYRGEINVIINSHETLNHTLIAGQRIAQLTFYKVKDVRFVDSISLSDTKRGDGGFGHTGM